jgi:hypothetical protein
MARDSVLCFTRFPEVQYLQIVINVGRMTGGVKEEGEEGGASLAVYSWQLSVKETGGAVGLAQQESAPLSPRSLMHTFYDTGGVDSSPAI